MKLNIDHANSLTGWNISSPSTIQLNEFDALIAGLNDNSLLVKFSKDDTTRILSKTYTAIDVTKYDTLIFSIKSENFGRSEQIVGQFEYKIKINNTDEYYIPIRDTFTDINIDIESVTSINRIEITKLTASDDYIWLSEILVEKENVILDLLNAVKEHIEYEINKAVGNGVILGVVSSVSGDLSVTVGSFDYLEQYAVIEINDGVNSETHQIDDIDQVGNITFNSNYDGKAIINDFTDADFILKFPVYINPDEQEIRIPGIVLWGFTPTPVYNTGKLDKIIEAYNIDGSFSQRSEGQMLDIGVQIDCEARQYSLLDIMSRAVRFWLEKEITWVNGRFHETSWRDAPIEIKPPQGIDIIPKIQYNVNIESIELFGDREKLVPVSNITVEVINE